MYLHLLQCVAHVGVGVGEVRWDGNGLLVVHQSLVKFTLLLEHTRQVGMSHRELRVDLITRQPTSVDVIMSHLLSTYQTVVSVSLSVDWVQIMWFQTDSKQGMVTPI